MLSDIITQAVAAETDMVVVASLAGAPENLGRVLTRRGIDVVIFDFAERFFEGEAVERLLRSNPRLGLLAIDGAADDAVLHHLVPVHRRIGKLAQSSLAAAIRAGAKLRRGD